MQDVETLIHQPEQVGRTHRTGASRGELDCQGHAVEPAAQFRHCLESVRRGHDRGPGCRRPIQEQLHRRRRVGVRTSRAGKLQRIEHEDALASRAKRFTARGEDRHRVGDVQHRIDQLAHTGDDMLAVVEHDKWGAFSDAHDGGAG